MNELIENLNDIDHQLFLFLNGLHANWLDGIMLAITAPINSVPLYLLLIFALARKYGLQSVLLILLIVVAVGLSDFATSGILKPTFQRLRPCHDPEISVLTHIVGKCGGIYSFASSHASTSFGLAAVILGIQKLGRWWSVGFFLWAIVYSYSRIYVGVHYPGDVLVGASIGIAIGLTIGGLYRKNARSSLVK